MLVRKEWQLNQADPQEGSVLERILAIRGIHRPDDKERFLQGGLAHLHDPLRLPDMRPALERLSQARRLNEPVLIHGDYDADGLTATALLVNVLRQLGMDIHTYIPDRMTDGYGLSPSSLDFARESGCSLMVTVDCGISNRNEISQIRQMGIDVIVTDHHACPEVLPDTLAVINPHREDSDYPFEGLAGVGVACKLAQAFCEFEQEAPLWQSHLDLVALGTVADVVPLLDENRILVRMGLSALNTQPSCGLDALLRVVNLKQREISGQTLGYVLAPRMNAAGRLGRADLALSLLLSSDPRESEQLAVALNELNTQRQKVEGELVEAAVSMIEADPQWMTRPVLIASGDDWHQGVLGIVAARLSEKYTRPVIVLSRDGDDYQGSGRSWGRFDLLAALKRSDRHLSQYGGHRKAAGLRLACADLPAFYQVLSEAASELLPAEQARPVMTADVLLSPAEMTEALAEQLKPLAPFGEGNEQPVMMTRELVLDRVQPAGNGRHLRLSLSDLSGHHHFSAIGFGLGDADDWLRVSDRVDVLYHLEINVWQGRQSLQLNIRDIRLSQTGRLIDDRPWEIESTYEQTDDLVQTSRYHQIPVTDLIPDQVEYKAVYQYLSAQFAYQPILVDQSVLALRIARSYRLNLNMFRLARILHVFAEAGLLQLERIDSDRVRICLCEVANRVKLESSPSYLRLQLKGSE